MRLVSVCYILQLPLSKDEGNNLWVFVFCQLHDGYIPEHEHQHSKG